MGTSGGNPLGIGTSASSFEGPAGDGRAVGLGEASREPVAAVPFEPPQSAPATRMAAKTSAADSRPALEPALTLLPANAPAGPCGRASVRRFCPRARLPARAQIRP